MPELWIVCAAWCALLAARWHSYMLWIAAGIFIMRAFNEAMEASGE